MPVLQVPSPRGAPPAAAGQRFHRWLGLSLAVLVSLGSQACGDEVGHPPKSAGGPHRKAKGKGGKQGGARKSGHGGKRGPAGDQALKVGVVRMEARDIQRHYTSAATLLPMRRAEIRPLQSGIITELSVEEGDRVEAKQILARLDEREIGLQAARDDLTARNAQKEFERLEDAAQKNIVAREELEKQRFAVDSAKATSRLTRHQVGQRKLRAPFSGTITARLADIGNLASPSEAVYQLADMSALKVEVHVPELQAASIALGDAVELSLIDKRTFAGKVQRRAPIVDALTGTIKFTLETATFPAQAMPGAFVRASILIDERRAVPSLPNQALFEVNGKSVVFIVADGRARRAEVETGLAGPTHTEILSGLGADDLVIRDGSDITVGTRVSPSLPKATEANRTATDD